MQNVENNVISIHTHKEITRLYKAFLELIEDIRNDHNIMLNKISSKYGQNTTDDINYFTQEKYEQIRKRVLDGGNETTRQILNFLDYFDFVINKEKVETAASQRRIVKKFVTNSPIILK